MIAVQLDSSNEKRLQELANQQGRDIGQLVAGIIEAYLDAQAWGHDSAEQWADASAALAGEVFAEEDWADGDSADGSW
jgi:predicted transcriptional regulator